MIRYDRKAAERDHGASYRLVLCPDGCVYCSLPDKFWDHVPPLRFAHAAGPERFLYPACYVCNVHLGPLPDVCLKVRAAYLVRSLRAEWKAGRGKVEGWKLKAIEKRGKLIKDRLASGEIARVCQCVRCRSESTGP